jgi:arylsulfatase A-like enzyme
MTGQSALSLGVVSPFSKQQPAGVPVSERMLPEYFQDADYQTFMVGKWHLGFKQPVFRPNNRGFEHFYGHLTGGVGYWDHVHGGGLDWQRNGTTLREQGYTTHLMRDEYLRLIRERDAQRPFFLYIAFNAPHLPGEAPQFALEAYQELPNTNRRLHAAMVSEMDEAIGALMEALREQHLLANTLIWFMSDNGGLNPLTFQPALRSFATLLDRLFGERSVPVRFLEFLRVNALYGGADNQPLRGGKQTVYEGGTRVPSFVYWAGTLTTAIVSDVVTASDVLPTLLSATDLPPATKAIAGLDRWPVILGRSEARASDYLITGFDGEAIIRYPWKLIVPNATEPELYQIDQDPAEQFDLAVEHPELTQRLQLALTAAPRAEPLNLPLWRVLGDPDFFGGIEDRPPWSEWQPE